MEWLSAIVIIDLALILWNWVFRPGLVDRRERARDTIELSPEEELEVEKLARKRRQKHRLSH